MKRVSKLLLLLPIFALSYELNFNNSFSKSLKPDILSSTVNISVTKENEKSANKEIEKFNDFLKNTKNITLKNTNYNLTPKYEYIENNPYFKGFIATINFVVESKESSIINSFLSDLLAFKDSQKKSDIKINISNLSWDVSEKLQNKIIDNLRLESILWIEDYAKEISKKSSKKCEIKSVIINEDGNYNFSRVKAVSFSTNSENMDISPIRSEQNIKINTNYILDCK
ncbi:SIMPL domain-containing protein [Aliarcobacter skirrowii]|uniref:SIMPL domain-containing protein n=1 Tax=Aliarcobacter skirrowii TaxID=28200 RepID=A0AAW9D7K7_9BACT|nr:SIMPL domain-containing protein [Aliarcobacter skirrowii]MDX4026916.1 SIMPL domain-containing protein [Aliarcobacter skirrowii]MDX4068217.1 SIMPL domain-containing protein [Aliarcobacter skirrowii]